jgi:hypothetical protein
MRTRNPAYSPAALANVVFGLLRIAAEKIDESNPHIVNSIVDGSKLLGWLHGPPINVAVQDAQLAHLKTAYEESLSKIIDELSANLRPRCR